MTMRNLIEISTSRGDTLDIQLPDEFDDKSSAGAVLVFPGTSTKFLREQVKFPIDASEALMVMGAAEGSAMYVILGKQPGSDNSPRLTIQRISDGVSLHFYKKGEQPKEEEEIMVPADNLIRAMKHVIRICALVDGKAKEAAGRKAVDLVGSQVIRARSYPPDSYYPPDPHPGGVPSFVQNRPGQQTWRPPQSLPDWHILAEGG